LPTFLLQAFSHLKEKDKKMKGLKIKMENHRLKLENRKFILTFCIVILIFDVYILHLPSANAALISKPPTNLGLSE